MSDRVIQFNPAPANPRGSSSVGQPIAVPSRVVVPELASSDAIPDSFAYPKPVLLYNGLSSKRKGKNKDQETVWVLFGTDLYFSLS
ncbi:hypothetical protein RO3G_02684 [Rhizopus delemar RA 99-880]|uniref:Uncharacterized protein n=1 Tax=Rhizopus delemar (strain RA 99-880 / ATCC MYA-4621 / FGSC 9543 / NRRL 43880) TaxID=246409 RepID=I1BP50_RHIO9|nr:hypothetical protein RO3G_02684 [Rhizopus delemar RA 99-880]|eukprot:EIE77980.1 hypothetical protein RO3G_02684 [Rhizopus delemar RA 99-880]